MAGSRKWTNYLSIQQRSKKLRPLWTLAMLIYESFSGPIPCHKRVPASILLHPHFVEGNPNCAMVGPAGTIFLTIMTITRWTLSFAPSIEDVLSQASDSRFGGVQPTSPQGDLVSALNSFQIVLNIIIKLDFKRKGNKIWRRRLVGSRSF